LKPFSRVLTVTVVSPSPTARIRPFGDTVAMEVSSLSHLTSRFVALLGRTVSLILTLVSASVPATSKVTSVLSTVIPSTGIVSTGGRITSIEIVAVIF
jgi:hypothetical protein